MTKTRRKTALSAGNEAPGGRHGFTKRLGSGGRLNVVWRYLSLGLECKLTFSSPVATVEFSKFASILSVALSQHNLPGFKIAELEFHHLH